MGDRNLEASAPTAARWRPRSWLPWIAGAAVVAATASLVIWTQTQLASDRDAAQRQHTAAVSDTIEEEMVRYADVLRAGNAFLAGSARVEPGEFAAFVDGLDLPDRYPGAQIVATVRPTGTALPVGLIEPPEAARLRPGDDLFIVPEVRAAVAEAGRSGAITMSAPVTQTDGSQELFIVQPDDDVDWMVARVRLDPLLDRVAADTRSTGDRITVVDVSDPEPEVLASRAPAGGSAEPDGPAGTADETVFGRRLQVAVVPPDVQGDTNRLVVAGLLSMGLAAAVVVIAALIGLSRSQRRALAMADAASRSEQRRRQLVELAPVAIAEVAGNGRVAQANAAARRLLGTAPDGDDAPLDAVVLAEPTTALVDRLDDLHGTPLRLRTPSGDHHVVAHATAVTGGDADHLLVLIDETARRRLEDRLADAEKMEALGLLAGGVAHDFNNLLMPIQGFIELVLLNDELGPDDRASLEEAHAACGRASALVEQLLTTSTPEVGSGPPVDVVGWLRAGESLLRSMLPPEIHLEVSVPDPVGPAVVRCDATRLEQVVVNLVVNARDAMRDGGTITVRADLDGGTVTVAVQDQGDGMDEATRSRIFEPFFTTKARRGGTGLGLATVYSTVVQADGTITVESTPGQGSTFTVHLPLVGAPDPRDHPRPAPDPPAERRATILVVDDEEYARQLLRQILADEPYHLLVASSAEEAEQLAGDHPGPIDLVLTDVVLGGRSGPELTTRLRAGDPSLPAIFVSGYVDDEFGPQGSLPAHSWFLAKPFRIEDLRAVVRLALTVGAERS